MPALTWKVRGTATGLQADGVELGIAGREGPRGHLGDGGRGEETGADDNGHERAALGTAGLLGEAVELPQPETDQEECAEISQEFWEAYHGNREVPDEYIHQSELFEEAFEALDELGEDKAGADEIVDRCAEAVFYARA